MRRKEKGMQASTVAFGVVLVMGAALGLAVYEALIRRAMPKRQPASARGRGEETPGHAARRGAGAAAPRVRGAIASLGRALDRFAPMERAEVEAGRSRLTRAGVRVAPETWRAARVAAAMVGGFAAWALSSAFAMAPGASLAVLCGGVLAGWVAPIWMLSSKERARRRAVDARLPDAMELLGIAIAAGSPVEQCFREVAASLEGPIAEEFSLVDQEVNLLGHARETALANMADRCRSQEVGAFVAQVTQSITQGTSVAEGLAGQAALARETAQADALERIRKMPTKLDVVLSMCFLPPTVVLVVAPTVVNLLEFLNDTMA